MRSDINNNKEKITALRAQKEKHEQEVENHYVTHLEYSSHIKNQEERERNNRADHTAILVSLQRMDEKIERIPDAKYLMQLFKGTGTEP